MSKITVWTPGDARVWWACPVCKTEAGITPPIDIQELLRRVSLFRDEHAECNNKRKTVLGWR